MTLRKLIEGVQALQTAGGLDAEVSGLATDTRRLAPGELFVALKGERVDGHDFIADAVRRGASAVLYERQGAVNSSVPSVRVEDSEETLARISNNFYRRPSEKLTVIGITGTNGKTTTSHLVKSVLEAAGNRVGLIGTINYMIGDRRYPAPFTTPEAPQFQGLLRDMLEAGCSHVVAEVSSHALARRRVDCTEFKAAVFTNLTRDHLDFHRTMEEYFRAKGRLFTGLLSGGTAVINADDPYGRRLCSLFKGIKLTYSVGNEADIRADSMVIRPEGLSFSLSYRGRVHKVESPLTGIFNVYNILSAVGACLAVDVPWEAISAGIRNTKLVKGRFEKVDLGQDFLCVVDYAHTEDALRKLILAAREMTRGRVITVFGCGGDRDRGKRPAMGSCASELSDEVVITSDNPRGEDPMEIIREITVGMKNNNYRIVPDRAEAIKEAVMTARASDSVIIAGKGHEDYQEIKGIRRRFSDREAAEDAIRGRSGLK
jgi:UDP-N-acetylmuramoyl-L-alanyl-D-glutamate--2,6-diaminopimelate ligase